jgi:hypothetical protein
MAIDREWHKKHRMPPRATDDQRLHWHLEHSKHCDCRPLSQKFVDDLKKRSKDEKE